MTKESGEEKDPFGKPYKMVMKKFGGPFITTRIKLNSQWNVINVFSDNLILIITLPKIGDNVSLFIEEVKKRKMLRSNTIPN